MLVEDVVPGNVYVLNGRLVRVRHQESVFERFVCEWADTKRIICRDIPAYQLSPWDGSDFPGEPHTRVSG